jgi:hypothetical protein
VFENKLAEVHRILTISYPTSNDLPIEAVKILYEDLQLSMHSVAKVMNTSVRKVFQTIKDSDIHPRKQGRNNKKESRPLPVFSEFKWGMGAHPLLTRKIRLIGDNGYVLLYMPEHHLSDKNGYVLEHRYVAEENMDRQLLPKEVVHHRDGNKQNNSIENLEVMDNLEHCRLPYKIASKFKGVRTKDNTELHWLDVAAEVYGLFCRKNADYGPNNIAGLGEEGVVVRMFDKFNRLKTIMFNKQTEVKDESIEDTILDIIDYGIILLLVKRGLWPKYEELDFSSWDLEPELRAWFDKYDSNVGVEW